VADSRHGGGAANQSGVNVGEPRSSHTGHNLLLNFECYRYIYLSRYAKSQMCVGRCCVRARDTAVPGHCARRAAPRRRAGRAPAAAAGRRATADPCGARCVSVVCTVLVSRVRRLCAYLTCVAAHRVSLGPKLVGSGPLAPKLPKYGPAIF
jgi:hypothetical protein